MDIFDYENNLTMTNTMNQSLTADTKIGTSTSHTAYLEQEVIMMSGKTSPIVR